MRFLRLLIIGLLCAACAPASPAPVPRKALPEPIPFVDTNPDPDIVEVSLVVSEGSVEYLPNRPAEAWGYLDAAAENHVLRVPGPLIEAKRGDLVIVHARNELPKDGTSIHFHGVRLSSDMDGAHHAMLPGIEWEQRFIAKDAGLFWYHPHIRADVQLERGLYGPLVIRDNGSARTRGERILVLDDVKLGADGNLAGDWSVEDMLHGRQGNVLLVNGIPNAEVRVTAGSRERWRLVNTSNGRLFHLELEGHSFSVMGWDGGFLSEPYETFALTIAPGERYDVLVDIAGNAGDSFALRQVGGHHGAAADLSETILTMVVEEGLPVDASPLPSPEVPAIPVSQATPERTFVLEEDLDKPYGPIFTINKEIWPFHTPIEGTLGALEIWRLQNAATGDHPFHLHGMFFQVLDIDGFPSSRLGWKDTVLVPSGATLRFAVRYDEPGVWMYHCQIPEHAERGMMGDLIVAPP
jgi:FtsP/CotA-like multicopper oxidase with cupredoxin domain